MSNHFTHCSSDMLPQLHHGSHGRRRSKGVPTGGATKHDPVICGRKNVRNMEKVNWVLQVLALVFYPFILSSAFSTLPSPSYSFPPPLSSPPTFPVGTLVMQTRTFGCPTVCTTPSENTLSRKRNRSAALNERNHVLKWSYTLYSYYYGFWSKSWPHVTSERASYTINSLMGWGSIIWGGEVWNGGCQIGFYVNRSRVVSSKMFPLSCKLFLYQTWNSAANSTNQCWLSSWLLHK